MSENTSNQQDLIFKIDVGNQAKLVPADVKDCLMLQLIGGWEVTSKLAEIGPGCPPGNPVPTIQRRDRIGVIRSEFDQPLAGNDMH
jgi:hypothetical protein